MNTLTHTFASSKIVYSGLGFILTLISGLLLSRLGRPLNSAVFTVHKLAAVGTIILAGMVVFNLIKESDIHVPNLTVVAFAGLLFLALLVSGALLSFDKLALQSVLWVHQIAPFLALAFSALGIYMLLNSRS